MKSSKQFNIICCCGVLCLGYWLPAACLASTSGQVLELSLDARSAAMGDATLAVPGYLPAWRRNPAILATLSATEFSAAYRNEFEDVQSSAVDAGWNWLPGYMGAEVLNLNSGRLAESGVTAENDWLLTVGTGKDISTWLKSPYALQLGVSASYFRSTLAEMYTGQAVAADLGVLTELPLPNARLAVAFYNLGTKIRYDTTAEDLPSGGAVGLSWHGRVTSKLDLILAMEGRKNWEDPLRFQAGAEWSYQHFCFIRGGYRFFHDTDTFTAGVGAEIASCRFEYAFLFNQLSAKHIVSIGYRLSNLNPTQAAAVPDKGAALLVAKGLDAYQAGRIQEAKDDWSQALVLDPANIYAQRYVQEFEKMNLDLCQQKDQEADTAEQQGGHAQAAMLWNQVLQIRPGDSRAREGLARQTRIMAAQLDLAESAFSRQAWAEALGCVQEALNIRADYLPGLALQAKIENQLKQVQNLSQHSDKTVLAKAQAWLQAGQLEKALALVKKVLSAAPQDAALLEMREKVLQLAQERGQKLKTANQIQQALAWWQRMLNLVPDYAPAKAAYQELKLYYQEKIQALQAQAVKAFAAIHYLQAIALWEQVARFSADPEVTMHLAEAYEAQGIIEYRQDRLKAAITCWNTALKLDPNRTMVPKYISRAKNKQQFFKDIGWEVEQ